MQHRGNGHGKGRRKVGSRKRAVRSAILHGRVVRANRKRVDHKELNKG